jgi:methionine-gamma-lyase
MKMSTLAIHPGNKENAEHAHTTPIYASSTFTFENAEQGMRRFSGVEKGFTYSRFGNPTTAAAEEIVSKLEAHDLFDSSGAPLQLKSLLHSSGQAALTTMIMSNVASGQAIVSDSNVYGGTYEFFNNFLPGFGVNTHFIDLGKPELLEEKLKHDTSIKIVHIETPANPTMHCVDLQIITQIAKQYGKVVTVDNTFATPYLQQPFAYGVDFVYHSTTKFLNGHGTAIGGVLVGRDRKFMESKGYQTFKLFGGNSNPFDAFMLIQGIKTLPLRMDKHCANAVQVAEFLQQHGAVKHVNYNGLPSHPDYELSKRQMRMPGAVMSFELKEGFEKAVAFINKLRVCTRAVSLGTVDTLVSHPASMSHSGMTREERLASGVSDGLIRMSVGLEDADDLMNDLQQALA